MRAYLVVILLLLAIFGSIGAYLYQRFSAFANMDFSPPPVTIAVSTTRLDTWSETLNAVGTIRSVRGVELTSETSGEVTAIHFDSGDRVTEGKLLMVLNDEVEQIDALAQLVLASTGIGVIARGRPGRAQDQ